MKLSYFPLPFLAAILAAWCLIFSCSDRDSRVCSALEAADLRIMTDPEAALDTLYGIDSASVRRIRRSDWALYTLMMTEARYKCFLPVAEDTTIFKATDYYRRKGPKDLLARALMMEGAVLSEQGDAEGAMLSYKEAEPIFKQTVNSELAGLLHTRIGELYHITFSDVGNALYHYRLALENFENSGAENRLAAANLTISRMLLYDSLDLGREYFIRGTSFAKLFGDTVNLIESANQEARYLLMHEEAPLQAARLAVRMLESEYRKWMTKSVVNDFCHISAEGFLEAGKRDSSNIYISRMTVTDAVDSLMEHMVMRKSAELDGDITEYIEHDRIVSALTNKLNLQAGYLALKDKETVAELRYALLEGKYRIMLAVSAATVFMLMAVLSIILIARYRKSSTLLKDHIKKGTEAINRLTYTENDVADSEADDIKRFSDAIEKIAKNKKESQEKLTRLSVKMIFLNDAVISILHKYSNPETFQRQIQTILEKHRSDIVSDAEQIVNTVYPGFIDKLMQDFESLTRKDQLIVTLTICGFSTDGICWLTSIKAESLTVYRSNINKKMSRNGKLSDNLFQLLTEHYH